MLESQPGVSRIVVWGGAVLVILLGFIVLPVLIWILPFRWLHSWPRVVLVPMCAVGTLGYFLAAWAALQWLARGARSTEPSLTVVPSEEENPVQSPQRTSEQVKRVYEEVLEEETDPGIRQVVQEALAEQKTEEQRQRPAGLDS